MEKYEDFFGDLVITSRSIERLTKKLLKIEEVKYNPKSFHSKTTAKIIKHSPKYRSITLEVSIGFFKFSVNVFIEERQSYSHCYATD